MRKRVSCRVIESVPLNQSEDGLFQTHSPHTSHPKTGGFNSPTYSDLPARMRIYMDSDPATGKLDILA
jgi:hypothetical protein